MCIEQKPYLETKSYFIQKDRSPKFFVFDGVQKDIVHIFFQLGFQDGVQKDIGMHGHALMWMCSPSLFGHGTSERKHIESKKKA